MREFKRNAGKYEEELQIQGKHERMRQTKRKLATELFYTPHHECPKTSGRDPPHIEDVHSVETMMLIQYYKENQLSR